jgi:hypothetical protein
VCERGPRPADRARARQLELVKFIKNTMTPGHGQTQAEHEAAKLEKVRGGHNYEWRYVILGHSSSPHSCFYGVSP